MRILLRLLIALIALPAIGCSTAPPSIARAEWKQIPCDQIKFETSIPYQKCDYHTNADRREIWTGAFHDHNSSAFVAVYTSPRGMNYEDGESYTGGTAYNVFFVNPPKRSELTWRGKWLSFVSIVKTSGIDQADGQANRKMNCLQFFRRGPNTPRQTNYVWTAIVTMCVTSGEVPETAADLVLDSLRVNIK